MPIANGVPVPTIAKRLGRSKVSTTYDFYSHSLDEEDEKVGELFGEIATKSRLKPVS